ncbi:MAG: lasso peptide biosynthesis B2 protein [Actinobacteria bacterium]|nr:lasso peptide biosynthesis B2 protein [Actinomycetota bacterium]
MAARTRPGRAERLAGALPAFLRRDRAVQMAALRLLPVLARVELGLRTTSVSELARRLGIAVDGDPIPRGGAEFTERERAEADAARRLVRRWPAERRCLRRSLLIGHALRRHDPVLRFGAAKVGDHVHTHAWIEAEGWPAEETEGGVSFRPLRRPRPS